jgi:hypothetical protein
VGLLVFAAACHRHRVEQPSPAPDTVRATPRAAITTGASLLRAMRERYPGWYHSLTFTQRTTLVSPSGGEIHQTWYEAGELPGKLRIDSDLASRSGTLFARDSIFAFSQGKLVSAEPGLNELLVLGFDAYAQTSARTEAALRTLGFDLSRVHESTWQGKAVYVVGAARGDTASKQFWIDRENLLFVRLLEPGRLGRVDIRFNKYKSAGSGWIATEVVQYVNGSRRLLEEYSDVRTNISLSDALFDPKQWATVRHWAPGGAKEY